MNRKLLINNISPDIFNSHLNISQSSRRTFKNNLKSLKLLIGNNKIWNVFKCRKLVMESDFKLSTKKNLLFTLHRIYRHYFDEDQKSIKLYNFASSLSEQINKNKTNAPTVDEINKYISIREQLKKLIKSRKKNINYLDIITMYIYLNIACRRLEVRFIKVINRKGQFLKNDPHINLKDKYIYFPSHKSKESIQISLNNHLSLINKLKKLKLYNNNHLYRPILTAHNDLNKINASRKAFSVYLNNIFKDYFNVNYNIQKLRRLCASAEIIENNNITQSALNSKKMGHNLTVHNKIYQQIKQKK